MIEIIHRPLADFDFETEQALADELASDLKNVNPDKLLFAGFSTALMPNGVFRPEEITGHSGLRMVGLEEWKSIVRSGEGDTEIGAHSEAVRRTADRGGNPAIGVFDGQLLEVVQFDFEEYVPLGQLSLAETCLRIAIWD